MVDTSYTYYLGNVGLSSAEQDTTIAAYTNERGSVVCGSSITSDAQNNNCNVWYGNKATWNKSTYSNASGIALLYPSDYGYSASSTHWNSTTLYNYETGPMDTSWMYATANHATAEWMLSPTFGTTFNAAFWNAAGFVRNGIVDGTYGSILGVRPVLNLVSSTPIDINHLGDINDPYIILE